MTAINTPHILKIVGWIYKVSGDGFWQLWNNPEKPTHIIDHALRQGMKIEIEAVYDINEDVAKRKLVDPVEVAVGLLDGKKDKEDTEIIEISAGLLRQVVAAASKRKAGASKEEFESLQSLVAKLEGEAKSHVSDMIEVLQDCRTYIRRSEHYEKALREFQNVIRSAISENHEDGPTLTLASGTVVRGEVAEIVLKLLKTFAESVNSTIDAGHKIGSPGGSN
ncbi:hypothetical protein [Mesorhizobium sp. SP-1A]|uniref:hypothetical protein n=1 Tax=Mesorhizobium sp. SP-1A TaxID=3077840 RepID=UPI0028F71447|nr:hypothetical protein [Mesorhizobium sp. SP-1A]